MFGDSSPRTKQISTNAIFVIIAIVLILFSSIWTVVGMHRYNTLVLRSSTPLETKLKFTRSAADVVLSGIYTDAEKSALVIRLSPTTEAQSRLPFKGSDYRVYLSSKSLDGYKEADIIFAKMSTDGDMFLVIPKPTDDVYNVFIMNTKYLAVDLLAKDKQNKSKDQNNADKIANLNDTNDKALKASISRAISSYKYDPNGKNAQEFVVDDNQSDVISFRVTTKPAFSTPEYSVTELNTRLLTENQEFNFKGFFDIVFKESVIKTLEKQYEANKSKVLQVDETLQSMKERVSLNPLDSEATQAVQKLSEDLKELQRQQTELSTKHAQYSALQYSDSLFTNLQTKAIIVDTSWKGE